MEIGGLFTPVITQFFIRNQPANAGDSIKPWVERSGTQRKRSQNPQACGAGDRDGMNADCDERLRNQSIASSCRPPRGLIGSIATNPWVSLRSTQGCMLTPDPQAEDRIYCRLIRRLKAGYADACSAG